MSFCAITSLEQLLKHMNKLSFAIISLGIEIKFEKFS